MVSLFPAKNRKYMSVMIKNSSASSSVKLCFTPDKGSDATISHPIIPKTTTLILNGNEYFDLIFSLFTYFPPYFIFINLNVWYNSPK